MNSTQIQNCFNDCFGEKYRVELLGGGSEPVYIPPSISQTGKLIYRSNYASSALHEVAHWCIAGSARRNLIDFGYKYLPPPRNQKQQDQFFKWEVTVQALEWIFSDCAQIVFHPSADNLEADTAVFTDQLRFVKERELYRLDRLPYLRASIFRRVLIKSVGDFSRNVDESRSLNG